MEVHIFSSKWHRYNSILCGHEYTIFLQKFVGDVSLEVNYTKRYVKNNKNITPLSSLFNAPLTPLTAAIFILLPPMMSLPQPHHLWCLLKSLLDGSLQHTHLPLMSFLTISICNIALWCLTVWLLISSISAIDISLLMSPSHDATSAINISPHNIKI